MDNSNKKCLSEVSISFAYEESNGSSLSFTSTHSLRFFPRTKCKKRQNDNNVFCILEVNNG